MDLSYLQGKTVTLWPYARGECARDLLYVFWNAVEQAGDWSRLMWGTAETETTYSTVGDLTEWVEYVHARHDPKVLLFATDQAGALAGLIWYHELHDGEAHGCVWVDPAHRGAASREIVTIGCQYMARQFGVRIIWAITPWAKARNLIRHCGFVDHARLDDYLNVQGERQTVYILKGDQNG